jgi:hypothetical protein
VWLRWPGRRHTGTPLVIALTLPADLRQHRPRSPVQEARERDGRAGTCPTGKARYQSERDARTALAGIIVARNAGLSTGHYECRAYRCPICTRLTDPGVGEGWHLTSRPLRTTPPSGVPRPRTGTDKPLSGTAGTHGDTPASDRRQP